MLKARILTALVIIPLVLLLIFKLPAQAFVLCSALLFLACGKELCRMNRLSVWQTCAYLIFMVFCASWQLTLPFGAVTNYYHLITALWLLIALLVMSYPSSQKIWSYPNFTLCLGLVLFIPAWYALNTIRMLYGPWQVLQAFGLVWAVDIGAFFAGQRFGRTALHPAVSPNKTWEGVLGGLLLAAILTLACQGAKAQFSWSWLGLQLLVALSSVMGDLAESVIKRIHQVKDSGHILPGHGGFMDRLDSSFVALPIYLWGLQILGS